MTNIHHYDPQTSEFIRTSQARPDPLDASRYLVPRHATTIAPPVVPPQSVAVFGSGQWNIFPDLRGTVYWDAQGQRHVISAIGDTVPDGASLSEPDVSVEVLRARGISELTGRIADFTGLFSAGISDEELASWPTKAQAARDHLAGTPSDLIIAEATMTGEDPQDLAQLIADRAAEYTLIIGQVTGLRRKTTADISAAADAPAITAALTSAQTQLAAWLAASSQATGGTNA